MFNYREFSEKVFDKATFSCMTPWRLEMLLFLRSNRDLWDEKVVQQIILLNSNDETEALEEEDAEALEI